MNVIPDKRFAVSFNGTIAFNGFINTGGLRYIIQSGFVI